MTFTIYLKNGDKISVRGGQFDDNTDLNKQLSGLKAAHPTWTRIKVILHNGDLS